MANRHRGEVALGEHTLVMSLNAICDLEDALDKSIDAIGAELGDAANPPRLSMLRAVVWAGLQERHPGTTEQEAGRIMGEVGMAETMTKIGEAFQSAFPQAKEAAGGKARPRKAKD